MLILDLRTDRADIEGTLKTLQSTQGWTVPLYLSMGCMVVLLKKVLVQLRKYLAEVLVMLGSSLKSDIQL